MTKLLEEHFRYFMLYHHLNMSKGDEVFKNSILKTEERIRKWNELNKEKMESFLNKSTTAISLEELEFASLFKFEFRSREGLFKVFIHAANEAGYLQEDTWAGANAGDQMFSKGWRIQPN